MCDSMYSATISHKYTDNIINIHNFGPTPYKLSSKAMMGCRTYTKEHNSMNNKYKLYVHSSNKLEELEFINDGQNGDTLQDYMNLNKDNDNDVNGGEALKVKAKAKAKDGFLNGELMRKQLIKRSNLIAKQVIGVQTAFSLGFVSQLWVDTASWVVLEVEVRPSLLSSESGKVLLDDIERVGYNVVTPGGRKLGKVRGYTFNINSGAVESLELDAFGYSIIPSSLVSTYALFTEDILQVVSDNILVHESAASNMQRLTKGFLSTMNTEASNFNRGYDDVKDESRRPVKTRKPRRKSSKRKSQTGTRNFDDDSDLPMDYM